MIKTVTKPAAIIGWHIIKYKVPTTVASSVTLAIELVTGSGDVFIKALVVAFVRWDSREIAPVSKAINNCIIIPESAIAVYPNADVARGRIKV